MQTRDRQKTYDFEPSISGWHALLGRFGLFRHDRAPLIPGSVTRATEINSANRMRQPAFRALADVLIVFGQHRPGICGTNARSPG